VIIGIGIDSVEIDRFANWHTYSHAQLSRIFSPEEIEYCLSAHNKSAERFAARFATREAFFKAFTAMNPHHTIPFLTLCKQVAVTKQNRNPLLHVNWNALTPFDPSLRTHLSLTHTATTATAWVIIEKN
jgi:holo-[acyl-carrier protein] synthase